MAEPELSVLTRQCLGTRLRSREQVKQEVEAWTAGHHPQQVGVD
jgi:hypothetical protein